MDRPTDLTEILADRDLGPHTTAIQCEADYVEAMAAADRYAKAAEVDNSYEAHELADQAGEDVGYAAEAYINACERERQCIEIGCRAQSDGDFCDVHAEGGGVR